MKQSPSYYGSVIGHENVEDLREEQGLSVLQWFKQLVTNVEEGS